MSLCLQLVDAFDVMMMSSSGLFFVLVCFWQVFFPCFGDKVWEIFFLFASV